MTGRLRPPTHSQIIDISPSLEAQLAGWDGDHRLQKNNTWSMQAGASVTVGCVHGSLHLGAHVDAPAHFELGAPEIHELPLEPFWGRAQVVDFSSLTEGRPLYPSDFEGVRIRAPRLLLKTSASLADPKTFFKNFVFPSPELAPYLAAQGVILLGTDAPSMDRWDDPQVPGHKALFRAGISILEGLQLSHVACDHDYELSALPLKIHSGDAAWTRAALKDFGLCHSLKP